jgi:hypothetical protein
LIASLFGRRKGEGKGKGRERKEKKRKGIVVWPSLVF